MKNVKIIVITAILIIILTGFCGCINNAKHVTNRQVGLGFHEKDPVKVFYKKTSQVQNDLSLEALDLIYEKYEICSEIFDLPIQDLNPCSMVFCESNSDRYIRVCKWFAFVDEVQCWPIIGEESMDFKGSLNGYMFYHLLPHEIADTTLRERGVDYIYGAWFIEGVGEYTRLLSAQNFNQQNNSFWISNVIDDLEYLTEQEERIVNLSDRSSFNDNGFPGSDDAKIFYPGSLAYIYDLVSIYGDQFISDAVANNCKTYEELRSSILDSTGYDIADSITNVSVEWIKQRYISILDEFNVDYN